MSSWVSVSSPVSDRSAERQLRLRKGIAALTMLERAGIDLSDWRDQAVCKGSEIHVLTRPDGKRMAGRIAAAKAVCAACPVIEPCRDHYLSITDRWAIAGGMTPDERLEVQRMNYSS